MKARGLRVQIKSDTYRWKAVIELIVRGYEITVDNRNGDCLFIWIDQPKCYISHWTDDNPIIEIKDPFKFLELLENSQNEH